MPDHKPLFDPNTGILDRDAAAAAGLRGQLAVVLEEVSWSTFADTGEVVTNVEISAALDVLVPAVRNLVAEDIERYAESIGWYEGGGVWADAIATARNGFPWGAGEWSKAP